LGGIQHINRVNYVTEKHKPHVFPDNQALFALARRLSVFMPASIKPKHLIDIIWQAPALIAAVLAGEGVALIMTLAPGYNVDRWVYFGLSSFIIQWVILLTLGCLYLIKNQLTRYSTGTVSWIGFATLILSTWLICTIFWLGYNRVAPASANGGLRFLLQCTAISGTVGLLGLITLQHYWRGHQLGLANKQAELDALQARIQPHFLFNTLNTCAALVHQHPAQAEQLLLDLSELFRAALSKSKLISLEEELLLTRRYLEIESLRFGDRIRIDWRLPGVLPEILLPTLSIQPLAENAVRHGIEPNENGGDIEITIEQIKGLIMINVTNSLPKTFSNSRPGHQIGLTSTRERIENYSNGKGTLLTKNENGRFSATISLPLE
jgi:two-component system, LytTR family, sensor histidine kinase AlgZ